VINYTQSRQLNLLQSLGFESPSWTDLLRLLAGSLSALALLWLIWARATRPQRDGWSQLIRCQTAAAARRHSERCQRLRAQPVAPRAGELGRGMHPRPWLRPYPTGCWTWKGYAMRHPPIPKPQLKTLRRRWLSIRKQRWPYPSRNKHEHHPQ
jgi:hypothetical protein